VGDVWRSQSLEGVFYSGLTAVILATLWLGNISYPPVVIAAIYIGSVTFAIFLSASNISRLLAPWGKGTAQIKKTDGLTALAPSVIMGASEWTILLLVGIFLSISDAGIYRTLVMYGALVQMISTSFAIMSGPHLSRARASGDRRQFFSAVSSASYLGIVVAAPLVLAAVFLPEPILGLFGPEFVKGSAALGILAMSQLVGVAVGPAAMAMIMLQREKPVLYIEIIASIASLPLAFLLLREVGLIGPPIAVLTASLVRGVYTRWALWRAWPSA
jgi:O-antigen/teichoic acid export membrane protein